KLRFEDKISYSIEVDSDLDKENIFIPTMILQPMLENAVNHGVFHKIGAGHIIMSFDQLPEKDGYKVSIIDDGIGLEKSREIQKNQKANTKAHSSEVIKERLDILNESQEWSIDYQIIDRSIHKGKSGTAVYMTFKYIEEE
ncbi:MAG: histidine kinase transcriptional regulator protein, partial [Nonlabens sp.]